MKKYYAFDFDGVLVSHKVPQIGKPIYQNIDFLKRLKEAGHIIIIWTGRYGKMLKEMEEFLNKNNIPYDYINENPEYEKLCSGFSRKVFADYYFDDRNIFIYSEIEKDVNYHVGEVIDFLKNIKVKV